MRFVIISVALCSPCGCDGPQAVNSVQFTEQPQAAQAQARKRTGQDACEFNGDVVDVGTEWVELKGKWQGKTSRGRVLDNTPLKRFCATGERAGGNPKGFGEPDTYQTSELNVGDRVMLVIHIEKDGEEWIQSITILRRPGGIIPPRLRGPFLGTEHAPHLRHQAEQDWEEHRIPIPAKYLDDNGRYPWTNPPYMPLPVAPPPRPVKP